MFPLGLSILIGLFVVLVVYIICQQKANLPEIAVIIVAICIILLTTTNHQKHIENFVSQPQPQPQPQNETPEKPCTASQQGLVYGSVITTPNDPTMNRINQIIYENDIVNFYLSQSDNRLILAKGQTQLDISNQPQTYLQKLRIIPATKNQNHSQLTPIRYGEPIKLIFTMGRTTNYYISSGTNLGLTKQNKNNVFQLINGNSPQSQDAVKTADDVLLKVYSEVNNPNFITVSDINQITTNNTQKLGTIFNISSSQECNPNWMFNFTDPKKQLVSKQQANQIIGNYLKNQKQQASNLTSQSSTQNTNMNQTYMTQMKALMQERALLQSQIDTIKKNNNIT